MLCSWDQCLPAVWRGASLRLGWERGSLGEAQEILWPDWDFRKGEPCGSTKREVKICKVFWLKSKPRSY